MTDQTTGLVIFAVLVLLLIAMLFTLISTMRARRLFDQVLAINMLGSVAIAAIVAIGLLLGSESFVDIALLYALVNFVAAIAVLHLFNKHGRLSWPPFFTNRETNEHDQ